MNSNMQMLALMGMIVGFMAATGLWMEPQMRPMRTGTAMAVNATPVQPAAQAANLR